MERADFIAGIEIVDDATRRSAEWKLIRGTNKSFEGPVDALINWRFSMRITRFLSHRSLAVTPNHVTTCAICWACVQPMSQPLAAPGWYATAIALA